MSGPLHLARRFFGSLSPRPLSPADDTWVAHTLHDGERHLWDRLSTADRKHAAGVAREVDRLLGGADRAVLAAALLHDVGKIESGLGTVARAVATVLRGVVGQHEMGEWRGAGGIRGRFGSYAAHDVVGATLLEEAGSDPVTITWTREHHLPADRWTLPADVATALAAADDD